MLHQLVINYSIKRSHLSERKAL